MVLKKLLILFAALCCMIGAYADDKQPKNEIWYRTIDDEPIELFSEEGFGANYVCNTYENGKGIITFDEEVTSIGKEAFNGCDNLSSITLPSGVKSIGNKAFYECFCLSSITLPDGLTSIGDAAFFDCLCLTSIDIPSGVTSIGNGTFSGCFCLPSITLPDGLTNIGEGAFFGCTNLSSIDIPSGVTSIGDAAFSGCSALSSVSVWAETPPKLTGNAFEECPEDIIIYVLDADVYRDSYWGELYNNIIEGKEMVRNEAINAINDAMPEENKAFFEALLTDYISTIKTAAYISTIKKTKYEALGILHNTTPILNLGKAQGKEEGKEEGKAEAFGTLGEKQNGPAVKVTDKDGKEIILYNPKSVEYFKVR